jgi:hypothetical protein
VGNYHCRAVIFLDLNEQERFITNYAPGSGKTYLKHYNIPSVDGFFDGFSHRDPDRLRPVLQGGNNPPGNGVLSSLFVAFFENWGYA